MSEHDASSMSSRRPYFVRAMHEWISDNYQTPHLVVDASLAGVEVPQQFIQDGKIVLNLSHSATNQLILGNDRIEFDARFGGQSHHILVPMYAVFGIYARVSGQGMFFSETESPPPQPPATSEDANGVGAKAPTSKTPVRPRPQLKVVK